MLLPLKNEQGFTLVELVIMIVVIGILATIAIPRYVDLRDRAIRAEAKGLLEAGRGALLLDFGDRIVNTGQYLFEPTDASTPGSVFDLSDVTDLESEFQTTPRYPTTGKYNHPPKQGFRWWLVTQGSSSPPQPPVIDAIIDLTCDAANSQANKANDDCWVSKF
jgi:prepilin-type N-terminal cleavage/methylation domain-containing protein